MTIKIRTVSRSLLSTLEYNPDTGLTTNNTASLVVSETEDFYCDTYNGDFKSPTRYVRIHTNQGKWIGTETAYRPDGRWHNRKIGVQTWPTSLDLVSVDSFCMNQAIERLYDKLRGSVDLSIDLLQYKQTLATTSSLRTSILQLVFRSRRILSKYGNTKRAGKALGSLWLQWQYGIKPTVSTLHDLVKLANTPGQPAVYVEGVGKMEDSSSSNSANWGTKTNRVRQRCRIRSWYVIPQSKLEDLSKISSLNPASIGWEVIPFSFVVDWIVDIGGYLRSMETAALHRKSFKYGYSEDSRLWESFATYVRTGSTVAYGTYRTRRSSFERAVLTGTPYPSLPGFNPKLGWQRLLSAAALLTTFLPDSKGPPYSPSRWMVLKKMI